ncbi:hypothetical protein EBS80_02230, partial [bacterium]|nr:hypothetical protein [bacterium]
MNFASSLEPRRPIDLFLTGAQRSCRYVREIDDALGVVLTSDDPRLDAHGHFPTYFGIVPIRRRYASNPVLSDLFTRHELTHTRAFRQVYGRVTNFQDWTRQSVRIELRASLDSECYVYLEIPGLRAVAFRHEIWMDRFLGSRDRSGIRRLLVGKLLATRFGREWIRRQRLRAMNDPDFDDYVEHQIWNYGQQNMKWCAAWGRPVGYGPFVERAAWRVVVSIS